MLNDNIGRIKSFGGTSKYQAARKMISEHIILNSCDVSFKLRFYECPAEFFVAQMTDQEVESLVKTTVASGENNFFLSGDVNKREKALSYWKDIMSKTPVFQQNIEHCKFEDYLNVRWQRLNQNCEYR